MLAGLRLRHKLLCYYSLLFTISLSVGFAAFYFVIRANIRSNIESELNNTTTAIYNLVRTSATVSIKNYLRSAAEKNLEIIDSLRQRYLAGEMSEAQAKVEAGRILLSQTIGESGYIYCFDSNGIVVVHPSKAMLQTDVSEYSFVKDLVVKKKGYIEYNWKNPGENVARPKALYMIHYEPWDWFISVSSYREEFKGLVNVDDFRQNILDLKFGKTGYAYVIDNEGTAIIHPQLEGINILTLEGFPNEYLANILEQKEGRLIYPWKNPGESKSRLKFCVFYSIEEYDWIVVAASYQDEFYEPLRTLRIICLATFVITMLFVLSLTFKISEAITSPLQKLMSHFNSASKGNFNLRMEATSADEIGQLANYFNWFMEQLTEYSNNLKQEIRFRQETEQNLLMSENRYRSVMEAAADPIVIYDMEGKVNYFNPAFEKVFGWSLSQCQNKKIDSFVPQENWPETQIMIETIKSGKVLQATETNRYTKTGEICNVSISGAAFKDKTGKLTGSVVIFRDITGTKKLTKQLLDSGDSIRQDIGQDLHDDLCPHLIGIGGLVSALQITLEQEGHSGAERAKQVVGLIDEATSKARGLARGLCPVHLVSFGLQSALEGIANKTSASSGITCTYNGDSSLDFNDNSLATHLYYIVQEAVNNSVKHASATTIDISLCKEEEYIHLHITDNGKGIVRSKDCKGIGLQIMQYRTQVIGAFLEITSKPDEGTTIYLFMKKTTLAS
ncbi:MAG: histidine kinase [Desulfotalea sp.]|nr:MAG: histidine kinase [Desulfotalea sp.]